MEATFDAPVRRVWQALTDTACMQVWYFPALRKFEPVAGFRFEFTDDGSAYRKEWIVTEVADQKKLAHSWSYLGRPGASEVAFELFEQGGKTRLRLTHSGIESFPADPHFARHRFEDGWSRIIGRNLKQALEQGGCRPTRDP